MKRAPCPENPGLAEWGVEDAAGVDLSALTLARQRAYPRARVQGGYSEGDEKVTRVPGASCARKAVSGLAS